MTAMTTKVVSAHLDTLRVGDTVLLEGVATTVGRTHLKHCSFMGTTLRGDCRALQGRQVDVVLYPKWTKGEVAGYVRQP